MSQISRANLEEGRKPRRIHVIPAPDPLGAEVHCGRIQELDEESFREVYQAWLDHLVLVFRNQDLNNAELLDFTRRFGPLKRASLVPTGDDNARIQTSDVHLVSNVLENGAPIGILGAGDVVWHSDMASFEYPPTASILYADEVPVRGGDTWFNNMYLAYDSLLEETKCRLTGLTLKHEVLRNSTGAGTGASHPVVCTHPETGCNMLFLGCRGNTYINEMSREESDILLDGLWLHATQPGIGWRQKWRRGDVIVWDNRCLLHCREAFDPRERRILRRTQIESAVRPYLAPDALHRPFHFRGHRSSPGGPPMPDGAGNRDYA